MWNYNFMMLIGIRDNTGYYSININTAIILRVLSTVTRRNLCGKH